VVFLTAPSPDKAVEASIEVMMHVDLESRSSLDLLYRQWRVMNQS